MTMDRISDLPNDILQRILYFLPQEEVVRTSVLSKSWRHNWCTRPNLDLSKTNYRGNNKEFISTVDKTLKRYCDQRLCLEELQLCIWLVRFEFSDHEWVSLLKRWIPLLTTMGVKEFHLSIIGEICVGRFIDLPSVVFEAENLKFLHLRQCSLGQNIPENIRFVRLQELRLYNVGIKDEILHKITSSCPLLTTMWLKFCRGLKTIKLEKKLHKHLKHFTCLNARVPLPPDECSIEVDVPTLEAIEITCCNIRFHVLKFSNLKTLSLKKVEISSDSIGKSQLCIDAPNIKYFNYMGSFIPSISFAPNCTWSNLYLDTQGVGDAQSWFLRLSKLLQALRRSKIFLNIFHLYRNNMHIQQGSLVQDIVDGGNKPVVMENLELLTFAHAPALVSFLKGLLCICHPRNIYPSFPSPQGLREREREKKEFNELFCRIQKMRESGNQEIWHDLEDLTIESLDLSRRQWEPLHGTKLSESALLPNFVRIRFRLKWREDCESSSTIHN